MFCVDTVRLPPSIVEGPQVTRFIYRPSDKKTLKCRAVGVPRPEYASHSYSQLSLLLYYCIFTARRFGFAQRHVSAMLVLGMGSRSVAGRGTFPYSLKLRGRPVFCPPTFSGLDIFVLMHTVFIGRLEQLSLNLVS